MHLFYWLLIFEIQIALIFYLEQRKGIKGKKVNARRDTAYLIVSLSMVFIFHAFRNPLTFPDIPECVRAFEESKSYSYARVLSEQFVYLKAEVGFRLLTKVVSDLFQTSFMLFFLTSILIISSVFYSIKKYSPIYWFSVLIFVVSSFAQSLFLLRAYCALSIVLFSLPFVIKRKIIPFVLMIALAFTMHMSSLIFFPVYFIYGIRNIKLLSVLSLFFACFLLFYFNDIIFFVINHIIPVYSYYITFEDNYEGASWKMPVFLLAILILRIMIMKKALFQDGINRLLSIIALFSVVLYTAGMGFGLTSRMALFFTNMTFLTVPNMVPYIKTPIFKVAFMVFFIAFNAVLFLTDSTKSYWKNYELILF